MKPRFSSFPRLCAEGRPRTRLCLVIAALLLPKLAVAGEDVRTLEAYHLVDTIGMFGTEPGEFNQPFDVELFGGQLWVADSTNDRVQVLERDGTPVDVIGSNGTGDGQFVRNRGLGLTQSDTSPPFLYVSDAKNDRIEQFDLDGIFIRDVGSIGFGEEQFFRPRGIAVSANGNVFVCDANNHRMKIYTGDLRFIKVFGEEGGALGQFQTPFDCAISPNGELFVADTLNHRIQVFNLNGNPLYSFGTRGTNPGQFVSPRAVAFDALGNVYVCQDGDIQDDVDQVQKLTSTGEPLAVFGSSGAGLDQLNYPAGLSVGSDGRVYVADSRNHRISVWAPLAVPNAAPSMGGWKRAWATPKN